MKRTIQTILFVLALSASVSAQNTCWESIQKAQELFNSGDYSGSKLLVEQTLKVCDFSTAEKEEALVILAKDNIEMDNLEEVDKSIKKILKNNPNYKSKGGVQTEDFNKHLKKFKVLPVFSVGLKGSAVMPFFDVTQTFSILDSVDYTVPYKTSIGYSLGARIEIEPVRNLSINLDFQSTVMSYERMLSKPSGWTLQYIENLSYYEFPLYLRKYIRFKENVFGYVTGGAGWMKLVKSFASTDIQYSAVDPATKIKEDYRVFENQINQKEINKELRSLDLYEWLAGAGISYRKNNFRFGADVRYYRGLTPFNNAINRYKNSDLTYKFYYIDNTAFIDKIEFGVTVSYVLMYAVKKVK